MNSLPLVELLAPLEEGAPCGVDLEYDPAFKALEEAAAGKPEQQFGDTVIAAQEPDWREVQAQALELVRRTRDLRVAVMLARSGARQQGLPAYVQALSLAAGWLDRHWDHVHPQLDRDDNNDATMRLNALLPLADVATGLADLRSAGIGDSRSPLTVRQIELAAGKAAPHPGEAVPTPEGVLQALTAIQSQSPAALEALQSGHAEYEHLEATLTRHLGAGQGPDLRPLGVLLKCLADTTAQALGAGVSVDGGAATAGGPVATASPAGLGELRSRDDVVRSLERACAWIERNEPTNPAPLLIRRAQRLMNKSFIDIIRDLVPEGIDQVEKIAGTAGT